MARKLIVEIVGDSRSYERALGRSTRATQNFGRSMGTMRGSVGISMKSLVKGAAIIGGVTAAIHGLNRGIRGSISAFEGFEASTDKIVGLVGIAKKDVEAMGDEILKLGPEVGKSPKELADALFFVTSAGLRGKDAMDTLSVAAHASAAGLGETKVVADAVTSAINAYGIANLDASQASDVLVGAVREGKTEAASLAPVIGNVSAFASALGVSFDQVGAAIAAQTRITGDAKSASVQLTNVFSTLAKGAPKTRKGFAAVGLDLDKVRDTLKRPGGLLIALNQIKDAFKGNIAATAQAFPNIRALRGVLALVGSQADSTRAIFERMTKVTGATDKAFQAVAEGTELAFDQFKAAVNVLGIQVGAILAPVAKEAAKGLSTVIQAVSAEMPKVKRAVGPVLDELTAGIRASLPDLRTTILAIVSPFQEFIIPIFRDLGRIGQEAFRRVVDVFADSEGDIRVILSNLGTVIKSIWTIARPTIVFLFEIALPAALRVVIPILKVTTGLVKTMANVFTASVSFIVKAVDKFLGAVSTMAGALSFLPGIGDDFQGVADKIDGAREHLRNFADDLDNIDGTTVDVAINVAISRGRTGVGEAAAEGAARKQVDAATKKTVDDATRTVQDTTTATDSLTTETGKSEASAKKGKTAAEKAQTAYENLIDALSLKLDKAKLTRSFKDDIAVLKQIQQAIRDRIKETGKTTQLQRDLFQAGQDLKAAQADSRKALQFEALGLTAEGDKPVAGVDALKKALGSFEKAVQGTFLDTSKTKGIIARIRRVLSGGLGAVGRDVRQKIKEILADLNQQLRGDTTGEAGPKTAFQKASTRKLTAGLGLSEEQVKELRARLSQIGPGGTDAGGRGGRKPPREIPRGVLLARGTGPGGVPGRIPVREDGQLVVVQGDLVVSGVSNPQEFERYMQKKGRFTKAQRRGQRPGVNRGAA